MFFLLLFFSEPNSKTLLFHHVYVTHGYIIYTSINILFTSSNRIYSRLITIKFAKYLELLAGESLKESKYSAKSLSLWQDSETESFFNSKNHWARCIVWMLMPDIPGCLQDVNCLQKVQKYRSYSTCTRPLTRVVYV
jgi:hypothetical protein